MRCCSVWDRRCSPAWSAILAYNFFFLPPLYTFTIADPENVVALFFFAIVALIASNLAARVRSQAVTARGTRANHRGPLSVQPQAGRRGHARRPALGHRLSDRADAEGARGAAAAGRQAVNRGSIAVRAGYPPEDMLDEADLAAAKWCWEKNHIAGRGADTLPGAKRLFLPMRTGRGPVGVIGLDPRRAGPAADARPAAAAGCAGRPGGAGDRAGESGRAKWTVARLGRRPTGCAPRC